MREEEVREAVQKRYSELYPAWTSVRVTTVVPNVFGHDLAVVKAIDEQGSPTEGEICFIESNGKVRVFSTTEDLAQALRPEPPADAKMVEDAKQQIVSFIAWHRLRHGQNYWLGVLLVVLGIVLALSITAAGFFNYGVLAGVLGLFVALFIALQNAFSISEKAEFQRLVFTEADNLHDLLTYRVRTQSQFDAVLDSFMTLKKHAATNLPRGKGMEVVKEMYGKAPEGLR